MKYKHPKKSLKDLTELQLKKSKPTPSSHTFKTKLRLQPHPPGCLPTFPADSLAPIKLTINNQPELFLWHTGNTELTSEFNFALQLLSDLEVSLPKPQLLELAEKSAASIREQVQQFREVQGARHSYQGSIWFLCSSLGRAFNGILLAAKTPLSTSQECFAKTCKCLNLDMRTSLINSGTRSSRTR